MPRVFSDTVALRRSVRFAVNPDGSTAGGNGYAGVPAPVGLARFYQLDVCCVGTPDPKTSYLVDIKTVDDAVRAHAVPAITRLCVERPTTDPAAVLPEIARELASALPVRLTALRWTLTPYAAVEVRMTPEPTVLLAQRFDFAAAHRLHNPELSDEENRRLFGKCNNPTGHGHNYRVEPVVAVVPGCSLMPTTLEAAVDRAILKPFDHKHLNLDTAEFGPDGLNPSVEHIARVCFDRLDAELREHHPDASLRSLTVWETDRTCATVGDLPVFSD